MKHEGLTAELLHATMGAPKPDGYDIIALSLPRIAAGADMVTAIYDSVSSAIRPARLIHRLCRIAGIDESDRSLREWAEKRKPHDRARLLALAMFDVGGEE